MVDLLDLVDQVFAYVSQARVHWYSRDTTRPVPRLQGEAENLLRTEWKGNALKLEIQGPCSETSAKLDKIPSIRCP